MARKSRRSFRRNQNGDLLNIGKDSVHKEVVIDTPVTLDTNADKLYFRDTPSKLTANDKGAISFIMGYSPNDVSQKDLIDEISPLLDDKMAKYSFWNHIPSKRKRILKNLYGEFYIASIIQRGYNELYLELLDGDVSDDALGYVVFNSNKARIKNNITQHQISAELDQHLLYFEYSPDKSLEHSFFLSDEMTLIEDVEDKNYNKNYELLQTLMHHLPKEAI